MIDIWQEIYSTIKRNKLRTFLTGFAVAWGIFMLIVLLGAGNGLIHAFEQSASERAMNSIKIFPGWTSKSYDGLKEGRRVQLDNKDVDATDHYFPDHVIKAGATVWQGGINLSFGQEYVSLNLSGVYPNHTEVEVVKLFKGRFINEIDIKERRKVIVLHKKTAEILFDKTHTEPIGQFVNAGNVVYQVVGLYNDKGDSGDSDAYIPFTTLQTIYNKGDKLNNLVMTTKNLETIEANEAFEAHYRKVLGAGPRPYEWESARDGIPSYTDLVLCYGGSTHRTPFGWNKERFAPFVTYTDEAGGEHWLFDSFLCIEFVMVPYSINLGQKRTSGGREQWQELIDYWFGPDNGVNALEEAVGEAAARLGAPAGKRKVVMVMPDPIIYEEYADTNTSTTYWGELNGRRLDFAKASDRIAAYKWYIDSVRRLFDEADYRYVELAGFYIVSEDLATPGDGWNPELKRWEEVIPEVAEYLHALNESLCWIPYNRAAGYRNWKRYGIDYAYMQPNYFWDDKGEKPLSRFFSDIKANDLAMEFEFDDALLEKTAGSEVYRRRLREYMDGAKEHGIYGRKPLAYYHGQNTLYELSVSAAAEDRKLYLEFCRFVLDNPLRK